MLPGELGAVMYGYDWNTTYVEATKKFLPLDRYRDIHLTACCVNLSFEGSLKETKTVDVRHAAP